MKIAVAQIACALGDPEANLSKAREFSPRAKDAGAELIVFPEMADTGYSMPVIQKHASLWKTGFVPGLCEVARELSIAIVSGVSERGGSSIYNSQILVDAKGEIVAKYRKTHLYAIEPVEEHTCFAQGDAFASFELGNLQLGFSICYDLPISGDVRESWPLSRKCMHLFSLPRGLFRESNISACSRKLERSKTKATSLPLTASEKTITSGFAAAQ